MKPTTRLRFVEREIEIPDDPFGAVRKYKILQQWWAPEDATENEIRLELRGEWRDVATEKENV
jgi:hypothetical protein